MLLEQLRNEIHQHLEQCKDDKTNTPRICELISSEEKKEKIVAYIVQMVTNGGNSIAEALMELEYDFSNNKVDL